MYFRMLLEMTSYFLHNFDAKITSKQVKHLSTADEGVD